MNYRAISTTWRAKLAMPRFTLPLLTLHFIPRVFYIRGAGRGRCILKTDGALLVLLLQKNRQFRWRTSLRVIKTCDDSQLWEGVYFLRHIHSMGLLLTAIQRRISTNFPTLNASGVLPD